MSKIQDQIRELQVKQKKIDYVSYISDLLKNDKHCIDFKDVKEEILNKIDPFLVTLIEEIENGGATQKVANPTATGPLTADETQIARALIAQAASRIAGTPAAAAPQRPARKSNSGPFATADGSAPPTGATGQKAGGLGTHDKMAFAMDNRHLGGKRVQVMNDKNIDLRGEVVGLDAPMVLVKTDEGPTIEVPLERIALEK